MPLQGAHRRNLKKFRDRFILSESNRTDTKKLEKNGLRHIKGLSWDRRLLVEQKVKTGRGRRWARTLHFNALLHANQILLFSRRVAVAA